MIKRLFDITATTLGLLVIWPLVLVLAVLVRIKHGSPVLFCQQRPGLHGSPFMMYKFRTMTDDRDLAGNVLPDANRLTPFGRLLRSTSLDELPELINVLKGDMSLVGPRPLLMKYLPFFTDEEKLRHNMRPGITGWAQVKGRNHLPWNQRLALDVWYVNNWSLWLDLKILCETFLTVINRRGVEVNPSGRMLDLDEERSLSGKKV
jgi:sugar transferase EpsL